MRIDNLEEMTIPVRNISSGGLTEFTVKLSCNQTIEFHYGNSQICWIPMEDFEKIVDIGRIMLKYQGTQS